MTKIVVPDIDSGYNLTQINVALQALATELNDKVLYRDNPAGEPNSMDNNLDMNSFQILNLPAPATQNSPARLRDVQAAISGLVPASLIPFTPAGTIAATTVQSAIEEVSSDVAALSSNTGASSVGYRYAVGAQTTTVEKRLKTEAWITDYLPNGYVLDGSVDYTTQIQQAHDEADTVHYPAGTFLMGTVYLDQGASVLGAGKWVTTFKIKAGASMGFATRAFGVRIDADNPNTRTFRLGLRLENFGIDLTLMTNSDASRGIALEDSYDNVIRSVKAIDPLDETSLRWGLYLGRALYTTGIYDCTFGRVAMIATAPIANFGTTVYFHHLDSWHVKARYYQHCEFLGAVIQKDADKFDLDLAIDNWAIIGGDFENGGNFIRCTTADSVANIFTAGNAFGGFTGTLFGGAAGRPRSSIFMDEYKARASLAIVSCTRSGTTLTVQVDTSTAGSIFKYSAPRVGELVTLAGTTNFNGNYTVVTSDAVNNRFTVTVPASGANTTGGTVTPDPSVGYRYTNIFNNSILYDELASRLISRNRIVLQNQRSLAGFQADGSTEVPLIGVNAAGQVELGNGSTNRWILDGASLRCLMAGFGPQVAPTVFASLPSAATYPYMRTVITDCNTTTFNAVAAGGGANKIPVWSDGTNWRVG